MYGNYTMIVPQFVAMYFRLQLRDIEPNKKEKVWTPSPGFLAVLASRNNQLRDAGLLSHTYEQQELAQWKGLAIAMSNLILKHVK
jgi:hypothetical protein